MNVKLSSYHRLIALCALFFLLSCIFQVLSPHTLQAENNAAYDLPDEVLTSTEKLKPFLESLAQRSIERGAENFYAYSLALIRESYRAIPEKQYAKAVMCAEYAEKLSPDLPPASVALGSARWAQNKLLVHELLIGFYKAGIKNFSDLESLALVMGGTVLAGVGALLLTLLLLCTLSLIKYVPLAFHDLQHVLPKAIPRPALYGWALILLVLPLFLNLSIFWAALYWLLLLFSYHSRKEQAVIIALFLLFSGIPLALAAAGSMLKVPQVQLTQSLWNANYGWWGEKDIAELEQVAEKRPDDTGVLFSLGLMYKKEKNYPQAEACYKKVLSINPKYYNAQVNLGNLYATTKRWDQAIEEYKKAIATAPSRAAAHFNLSRAYLQKFMFSESETEILTAKKLDNEAISRALELPAPGNSLMLIDAQLFRREIWQAAYREASGTASFAPQAWDLVLRGVPFRYGLAATLGLLILLVISGRDAKLRIALKCTSCGRVICKRCHRTMFHRDTCLQCINVFEKREGSDPIIRERKMSDIKHYLAREQKIGKFLALAFPGSGYVWKGHPVVGTIAMLLFYFFLLAAVFNGVLLEGPWDFVAPPSIIGLIAKGIFVIGFGYILIWHSLRMKDKQPKLSGKQAGV